jgi:putative ABC transport system substrate-binding protein
VPLFSSCADYVQRILQGARPAQLRIQRAATLELVVNLAAARALGIALSHSVSTRANRVID